MLCSRERPGGHDISKIRGAVASLNLRWWLSSERKPGQVAGEVVLEPGHRGQWRCRARAIKARWQHAPTKTWGRWPARSEGSRSSPARRELGPEDQMQQTRASPS